MASDDVLNIRAAPDAQADKIGEFAHDAQDVEVMSFNDDRSWGLVNTGERSGWTSMRFLSPQPAGDLPIARRLSCAGTEPFWSLDITQNGET
ncbi:peptide-binding protein, partial [Cribrihabitans sp. XS_ASV171]